MEGRMRSFFSEYGLIILLATAGIAFFVFGILQLRTPKSEPIVVTKTEALDEQTDLLVDVSGAVEQPGIYTLPQGSRIADAIQKAGGIREDADAEFLARVLNQAEKIQDGQKIFIPLKGQSVQGSTTQSSSQSGTVNINTASASDLDTLPGVGAVTAEKIIANRPYGKVEELKDKKAVNSATFDKIKDSVSVY